MLDCGEAEKSEVTLAVSLASGEAVCKAELLPLPLPVTNSLLVEQGDTVNEAVVEEHGERLGELLAQGLAVGEGLRLPLAVGEPPALAVGSWVAEALGLGDRVGGKDGGGEGRLLPVEVSVAKPLDSGEDVER